MTSNQDARPFVDLRKDAEEFRSKFDDDILKCISYLDTKITTLICDPDSLGTPSRGVKQNALVEFSKAKYDIFISVKSLMNEMEREWLKYISEMKKLFIENLEIFLAGTKLEVKLPSDEFQSSPSFKKSPRKSNPASAITSSLYPIINTFAKNVAAFGSPLRHKDNSIAQKKQSKDFQVHNDSEISDDESDSEEEAAHLQIQSELPDKKGRATVMLKRHVMESKARTVASPKTSYVAMETGEDESSQSDTEEMDLKIPKSRSTPRGRAEKKRSLSSSDLNSSRSSSKAAGRSRKDKSLSLSDLDTSLSSPRPTRSRPGSETQMNISGHNTSRSGSRTSGRFANERKLIKTPDLDTSQSNSRRNSRSMNNRESSSSPVKRTENLSKSQNESKDKQQVTNAPQLGSSRKKGRQRKGESLNKSPVLQEKSPNIVPNEDSDKEKESDVSQSSLRGRKSKQPVKTTPKKTRFTKNIAKNAQGTQNESSKSEETSENESISEENRPSLRRNKNNPPVKDAPKKAQDVSISRSISLRGRSSAKITKSMSKDYTKSQASDDTETDLSEEQNESHKGKTPQKIKTNRSSVKPPTRATPARSSRRTVQNETPKQPSPKKSNLTSSSDSSESGIPRSPKKVTFTESDINDDLDVYSPDVRISKPTPRRKTLLPNLNTIKMPPATESPRIGRASSKRKTIAGTSDFGRISPPKRLKVSDSKRISSNQAEDDADDDNLLESDGSYSEWIPLKSIDGKIPTSPAVYELKVWRAKKTAFIGSAESLRQRLTLHKLRQNSGHKHLDKFIERNMDDIQIRYEVVSSISDAKNEVKKRVKGFVAQYKTTPAYN